jgi:hypothetical protein
MELYYVNRFQADIIKHINPNGNKCDIFMFFPLVKHSKTSNRGMMLTSMTLKETMGLIEMEDSSMILLDKNV